jgi:hypothetical protein
VPRPTFSPVTVTADAARSLALFGAPASLGAAAAWIGGLLAVFIPLSVWRADELSRVPLREDPHHVTGGSPSA